MITTEKKVKNQRNAIEDNTIEVILEKNRAGARGTVKLLFQKEYNKFSLEMESATINAFKNATNANKNHFSGWFVGIWGQYSNSSEIDEQVTMMSLKKLRDDLNFIMQEYKEKNMNIAAMHTQNFIKKLDAIIKPENEDLQTRQVIQ